MFVQTSEELLSDRSKALIETIVANIPGLNKTRRQFMAHILVLMLAVPGRRTILNLSRWADYCEKTIRLHFGQLFDWQVFNTELVRQTGRDVIIAFDPFYLPKSGKKTYGLSRFWSGVAGAVLPGIEFSAFALIDTMAKTALHYRAFQTPDRKELLDKGINLLQHYGNLVAQEGANLRKISRFFVADAYFSKKPFIEKVLTADLDFIGKMRKDVSLRYLYTGPKTGKKGAPKKFDGKVNPTDLRKKYFLRTKIEDAVLYSGKLNVKAWGAEMQVVFVFSADEESLGAILFTTADDLPAETIVNYYRLRFQIEFLYRDAKQFAGMTHCQSRSKEALDFHINASLTGVSVAKVAKYYEQKPEPTDKRPAFSLADIRNRLINEMRLKTFIFMFEIPANTQINQDKIRELLRKGQIAA